MVSHTHNAKKVGLQWTSNKHGRHLQCLRLTANKNMPETLKKKEWTWTQDTFYGDLIKRLRLCRRHSALNVHVFFWNSLNFSAAAALPVFMQPTRIWQTPVGTRPWTEKRSIKVYGNVWLALLWSFLFFPLKSEKNRKTEICTSVTHDKHTSRKGTKTASDV